MACTEIPPVVVKYFETGFNILNKMFENIDEIFGKCFSKCCENYSFFLAIQTFLSVCSLPLVICRNYSFIENLHFPKVSS